MELTPEIVVLEGTFDEGAARALRACFLKGATHVIIDFGQAREIHDAALAMLAAELSGHSPPDVSVRGLSLHHVRMLRYLGAKFAAAEQHPDDDESAPPPSEDR